MIDNSISWERFRFFDMDLYDTLLPSLVASQDSMKVGGCVVGILAVSMALLVAHETFVLSTYELRSMPRLVSVLHIANTVFHVLCGVLYPKEYHVRIPC
ncbi:MAG: uncharacterized protein KVP18_003254 [Porospora cf. gigantea A]|nr:MAG: hypothetical protein KVP18_003254 [Porospora cf. gigantea A]